MDLTFIRNIQDLELLENINLEKFTTIKLGVMGSIVKAKTIKSVQILVKKIKENNYRYHLIGWGANQVILNSEDTVFIKLDFEFDRKLLNIKHDEYHLPASLPLTAMTACAQKHGLMGWEVFTGIPASLGGAICMNAGTALGEIGDLITEVEILRENGDLEWYKCTKDSFRYRNNNFISEGDIVLSAKIKSLGFDPAIKDKISDYLEYRKLSQPLKTKNCGCVFQNFNVNIKAGQAIDITGLKGFGIDGLRVSQQHGNFIENTADRSSEEFFEVILRLSEELERQIGVKFDLEVKIY